MKTFDSFKSVLNSESIDRRQFIKWTLFGGALLYFQRVLEPQTAGQDNKFPDNLVGSNIYGWSQYYQRQGMSVYERLPEVVSALRDCGYDYLENFMDLNNPENNAKFADILKEKGLKPVSLYVGARLHEKEKADQTVQKIVDCARVCKAAGFAIIVCNPDPIDRKKTDEELQTQAKALNDLGAGLSAIGIKLAIHNHLPEMQDDARELKVDLDKTEKTKVGFCYDVHWVFRGGIKPQDFLPKYGDRVVCWHLRQSRNNVWYEVLDDGDIDFKWIANYIKTQKLPKLLTVELAIENNTQITRSVVENHKISREYVRKIFGV